MTELQQPTESPLLEVAGLETHFPIRKGLQSTTGWESRP
jgi:hypothetical protein